MNVEALEYYSIVLVDPGKWMVKQLVLNLVFHLLLIKIQITSFHYLTPLILVTKIECVYFITIQLKKHLPIVVCRLLSINDSP
jgi:hypothetical protein